MSGQIEQPRRKDDKEAQGQQDHGNKFNTLMCNRPVRCLVVEILDLCHWRVVKTLKSLSDDITAKASA